MSQFGFYLDSGLTQKLDANNPLQLTFNVAAGPDTKDVQLWFGSPDATEKVIPAPPDTEIFVSVVDTDLTNAHDLSTSTYRLALTQADLDTATDNTPLSLGTQVLGGTANAVSFWLRRTEPQQDPALYTDFKLKTNNLQVVPV